VTNLAFIGLGAMGAPMAANLIKGGYSVVGYNRSPAVLRALVDLGARGAGSVEQAVRDADVVVTMLPDTPDVMSVVEGSNGVFDTAKPGSLLIDFSTIAPEASIQLARAGALRGISVLDAPVSGGVQGARDGSLAIMVGGEVEAFERAAGVFDCVGGTVVHVGGSGFGQVVKAANQLMVAGTIELLSEALVFLEAYGVDTTLAVQVLSGGLAASTVMSRKAATMIERDFAPSFRLALHNKDMGIALAAARAAGVTLPVGALVGQLVGSANARGYGDLDHSALLKVIEQLSLDSGHHN
jgi:2-hydroxy-3-oxopropionate reductase